MANEELDELFEEDDNDDLLAMIQRWTQERAEEPEPAATPKPKAAPSVAESLLELEMLNANAHMSSISNPWSPAIPRTPAPNAPSALETAASRIWEEEEAYGGLPRLQVSAQAARGQTSASPARPGRAARSTPPRKAPMKQTKKKHPIKRGFALLLVLAILIAGGGYAFAYHEAGKVNFVAAEPMKDPVDLSGIKTNSMITNILLIGVDRTNADESTRSDTMLLLSIDRIHQKLKLTSFLRDSWVLLPSGNSAKLNAACSAGGAPLVMDTIALNFNVKVDHYALVDFSSFETMVDAIGGVAVPITEKEIDFLCKKTRLGKQIGKESMKQQMKSNEAVALTGEQALIYCRIRALDNDFMRTQRQRKVMAQIVSKAKQENPLSWLRLADKVLPLIETDMDAATLANLAVLLPFYIKYELSEHRVPANGTWKDATKKGQSVLELDKDKNTTILRQFIYE